ncbi:protoporphyrinogen oxidase [Occallatibacter riparius]|uniref:Coproporphyrinogen III oxidase n=1 Tax=Occallatibacter riparius TaxID=1002689 RepID=A0A9J7BSR4_9BACT|nr:protoporphyrinogen oxidase [Occallatibacter riparius]UWZ85916.1 protoporphyrinogen oxidase [Occallatibacter riparius]
MGSAVTSGKATETTGLSYLEKRMRTAIIGGGIAGLAAAYELEKARAVNPNIEYTLFESRERLGGSLATDLYEGSVLERGPDSFLTEKPAAAELCRELGIGGDLIPSNDADRKTWIVVKNRLVGLPDGLMFLVPTKLVPTALSPLFSIATKIRMGLELLHPPRPSTEDESVAALVERHFGKEAVDRLADPLLSGIYGGDATQLSARTVLPRLVEMEAEYGSLSRGMLAAHKKMRAAMAARAKSAGAPAPGAPPAPDRLKSVGAQPTGPRSIFTGLRGGLQQLVEAIVAKLDPLAIRLSTAVDSIERTAAGWQITAAGETSVYDAVIVASPAWAASAMLSTVDAELANELAGIPYSSSITLNLVYDEAKIGTLPEGFGFLVPASSGRAMLACTFAHRKFLGRTAPGRAVLRAFLGGMRNEALMAEPDNVLIATVRRELSEILGSRVIGLHIEPEFAQVNRWRRAMAQYAVGHKDRMTRINGRVAAIPGLHLVGNAYDGIGIPDCIRLGRKAAQAIASSAKK